MLGSPCYVAPEVLKGHYTEVCDMWSVGILLYFMITGTYPYTARDKK